MYIFSERNSLRDISINANIYVKAIHLNVT